MFFLRSLQEAQKRPKGRSDKRMALSPLVIYQLSSSPHHLSPGALRSVGPPTPLKTTWLAIFYCSSYFSVARQPPPNLLDCSHLNVSIISKGENSILCNQRELSLPPAQVERVLSAINHNCCSPYLSCSISSTTTSTNYQYFLFHHTTT